MITDLHSNADTDARLQAWARMHAATVARPPARPAGRQALPTLGPELAPRLIRRIDEHTSGVQALSIAVAPDGTPMLATGSHDATIRIWDLATGERRHLLNAQSGTVHALRFLPLADGTLLLVSGGGDVQVWDPFTGQSVRTIRADGTVFSIDVVVTSAGRAVLATLGSDDVTRIWDPVAGTCSHELRRSAGEAGAGNDGTGLLALEDGSCLVGSGFDNGSLWIWDAGTGQLLRTIEAHEAAQDSRYIHAVHFVPPAGERGPVVITGSYDHLAKVWDLDTGGLLHTLRGHSRPVEAVSSLVLADGRRIVATGSHDGTVRFWDADNGACLHTIPDEGQRLLWSTMFGVLADGTVLLVTGTSVGHVRVFSLTDEPPPPLSTPPPPPRPALSGTGEWVVRERPEVLTLRGHTADVSTLTALVLDDGTALLASGGADQTARVWDLRTGACLHVLQGHTGALWATALAPDVESGGALLVTGAQDLTGVHLWDALTGQLRVVVPSDQHVYAVAARSAPDGRIFVASAAGTGLSAASHVRVWEVAAQHAEHGMERPGEIYALALVPLTDGTMLVAAGGQDHVVTLADTTLSGRGTLTLDGEVHSIAAGMARDGSAQVVTGLHGGTVSFWDAETGLARRSFEVGGQLQTICMAEVGAGAWLLGTRTRAGVALWNPESGERLWWREESDPARARWWYSPELLAVADAGDGVRVAIPLGSDIQVLTLDVLAPWAAKETAAGQDRDAVAWKAAVAGLPALAEAGIEPPLGLLADLIELTGGSGGPPQLAPLTGHPGLERLRSLRWPAASRVALAALLLADVPQDPRFAAPGVPAAQLYSALLRFLADEVLRQEPFTVPVAALTAACETVTAKTIALLDLLGPDAVAADPVLPLRMRRHEDALPALDPRTLTTLSDLPRQVTDNLEVRAYSTRSAAGVVGLYRHGSPANILRSQLALPEDIFILRWVSGDLLYRLHQGHPQLLLEPITIVLDTTPPTFGPMEATLRLAAHTLAATLLSVGIESALIALDQPTRPEFIRRTSDLIRVWTTRTLQPPSLAPALASATAVGYPIAVLTTHHLAGDHPLTAGPALRLLTTHAPGEAPRAVLSPYRAHVPPAATSAEIVRAVARILSAHSAGQNSTDSVP